jgi:hypothetical protein
MHRRGAIEHERALGDVGGVVADPLDRACDPQRRKDGAQIACHRLVQRQQAYRGLADVVLDRIDGGVVLHDAGGGRAVARQRGGHCRIQLREGEGAHALDVGVEPRQFGIEAGVGVVMRRGGHAVSSALRGISRSGP